MTRSATLTTVCKTGMKALTWGSCRLANGAIAAVAMLKRMMMPTAIARCRAVVGIVGGLELCQQGFILNVFKRRGYVIFEEADIARQLFPDQGAFIREENRRWELTTNHWDLPIHVAKAGAAD